MKSDGVLNELWSVPIYQNIVNSDESWIRLAKKQEYSRLTSGDGDMTHKQILEEPDFSHIKSKLLREMNNYIYEYLSVKTDVKFEIVRSWIVKHDKNDHAALHHHANSIFSAVYYFDYKEGMGEIIFDKEHSGIHNITYSNIRFEHDEYNNLTSREYGFIPEPSMIICFPSNIGHKVTPNRIDKKRYCLAFDVFPVGYISEFGEKI
tara:strand:- start:623 stop:1240 length:618 start_codon:yes stop_codon:yes gene_type:complete